MGNFIQDVVHAFGWDKFVAPNQELTQDKPPANLSPDLDKFNFEHSPLMTLYETLVATKPRATSLWQALPDNDNELLILLNQDMPQLITDKQWGIAETKSFLLKIPLLLQRISLKKELSHFLVKLIQPETWDADCTNQVLWLQQAKLASRQEFSWVGVIKQLFIKSFLMTDHITQLASAYYSWINFKYLPVDQLVRAGLWSQATTTTLLSPLDTPQIHFHFINNLRWIISNHLDTWLENNLWTSDHTKDLALKIKRAIAHRRTPASQALGHYLQSIESTFIKAGMPQKDLVTLYINTSLIFDNFIHPAYENIFNFLKQFKKPVFFEPGDLQGSWAFLAGGKWAGLERARKLGLPVIDGFSLPVSASPDKTDISQPLKNLEARSGKIFGDSQNPLLLAVRSGAPISFPGQLATITNIGINDAIFETLKNQYGEAFASDTYARFIRSYVCAVEGIKKMNSIT